MPKKGDWRARIAIHAAIMRENEDDHRHDHRDNLHHADNDDDHDNLHNSDHHHDHNNIHDVDDDDDHNLQRSFIGE